MKRVANGNATYQISVIEDDAEEDVHPFTGKLSCDPKATNRAGTPPCPLLYFRLPPTLLPLASYSTSP